VPYTVFHTRRNCWTLTGPHGVFVINSYQELENFLSLSPHCEADLSNLDFSRHTVLYAKGFWPVIPNDVYFTLRQYSSDKYVLYVAVIPSNYPAYSVYRRGIVVNKLNEDASIEIIDGHMHNVPFSEYSLNSSCQWVYSGITNPETVVINSDEELKNYVKCFLFLPLAGLSAQTPYFYYYGGERQYLELNAKHAFVSAAGEDAAEVFAAANVRSQSLQIDDHSRIDQRRYWATLSFDDNLSDEAYLAKLLEIKLPFTSKKSLLPFLFLFYYVI